MTLPLYSCTPRLTLFRDIAYMYNWVGIGVVVTPSTSLRRLSIHFGFQRDRRLAFLYSYRYMY